MTRFDGQLHWFHTQGTSASVEVFLRNAAGHATPDHGWSLYGPQSRQSHMLPARFGFEAIEPGLWRTTVVDPCYWSPTMPALYQLQQRNGREGRIDRGSTIGLRRLEARSGSLFIDGQRWVFRAVAAESVTNAQMATWSSLRLGAVVHRLDHELLELAATMGVPVMLRLNAEDGIAPLRQAAACPAVQLVCISSALPVVRGELLEQAPNLLFIADTTANETMTGLDWADGILCPAEPGPLAQARRAHPSAPLLAYREVATLANDQVHDEANAGQRRTACEQLQRDLAPTYDLSGYIVAPLSVRC